MQPVEHFACTFIAALGLVGQIGSTVFGPLQLQRQRLGGFAGGLALFLDLLTGVVQPRGNVVFVFIEPARQLHDCGFYSLAGFGITRHLAGFHLCDPAGQVVLALADTAEILACLVELLRLAFAAAANLVDELIDRLVEISKRLGGLVFGRFNAFGQTIDHGAQQAVLAGISRAGAAAKAGEALKGIVPMGAGRIRIIENHPVEPLAQGHPVMARSRLGTRPSAGIDSLDAPRTCRRHANRSPYCPA